MSYFTITSLLYSICLCYQLFGPMELLNCHSHQQPLEDALWHTAELGAPQHWLIPYAAAQHDIKGVHSDAFVSWIRQSTFLVSRSPVLTETQRVTGCCGAHHFFLPVFFSGFSPLSERTDPPSALSDLSPLSDPPALLPSLRVPSSVDEVVGCVCPCLANSSCSLILADILVTQLFKSSCGPERV